MTQFSLAPGYFKLRYTVDFSGAVLTHWMTVPILAPSWALNPVQIGNAAGAQVVWTTGVDALVAVLRPLWVNTAQFIEAILYRQDTADSEPELKAAYAINLAGTSAGANGSNRQDVYTLRSANGNLYRAYLLENTSAVNVVSDYSALSADRKAYVDYINGAASVVAARDGSFLLTFMRAVTKSNDKLRKIRLGL